MENQVTLSRLLNQTFAEIAAHKRAIALFFAVMIPISALGAFLSPEESENFGMNFGFMIDEETLARGWGVVIGMIAAIVIGIVMTFYLYAAMVRDTVSPGFRRFWPWLGIYILATLAIGLGFVLLIVPGLILLTRWAAVLPLVIAGRVPAFDSFGASWNAVRGRSWSVFGAGFILVLGMIALGIIVGLTTLAFDGPLTIIGAVIAGSVDALGSVVFVAFSVGVYHLLFDDSEEMSQVFS